MKQNQGLPTFQIFLVSTLVVEEHFIDRAFHHIGQYSIHQTSLKV